MPTETAHSAPPATSNRTRLGTGSAVVHGDNRTIWARRFRELVADSVSDLGGFENVSNGEMAILRRAATLTIELERMEARFAVEEPGTKALDTYQRAAGSLRRLLEAVGLERRAKSVSTDLRGYIDGKAQAAQT